MPPTPAPLLHPPITVVDCVQQYASACNKLNTSVYLQADWKAVFDSYGLRTHWLVAQREGQPIGIMPLVRQSTVLFGHRLISLPWVDEAGAFGKPHAVQALLEHATHLAKKGGAKFSLCVKQPTHSQHSELPKEWSNDAGDKVLMRRRLATTSEDLWSDLSPKVRNQVRKAEKSGLTTTAGGSEFVDDFYDIYSYNMRDLGSPAHSLSFFETLLQTLDKRARIYCTRLEGKVIGAGLVLDNRPSLDIPWASSLRNYNRLCVNHALYWQILSDACAADYEWFHFGRSSAGSGQHKFKKQWGAEEVPLRWLNFSQNADHESSNNSTTVKEKFGFAQQMWAKLPLWLSQRLGPYIIRHAP